MSKKTVYILSFVSIVLILLLYYLKMREWRMSFKNILEFIILFFAAAAFGAGMIRVCTSKALKKMNRESDS